LETEPESVLGREYATLQGSGDVVDDGVIDGVGIAVGVRDGFACAEYGAGAMPLNSEPVGDAATGLADHACCRLLKLHTRLNTLRGLTLYGSPTT
jgi:hypothetical protein